MRDLPIGDIREMYLNKRMSSIQIAKQYGCCKATILKRLKAAGVELREAGVRRISVGDGVLREMYLDKRLSTWKIAQMLKCGRSTIHRKLAEMGITRDIAAAHQKYPRKSFSGDDCEKAYLIGFAVGDLRVRKVGKRSKTVKIDCGSTKSEQIELIDSLFSGYGRVWTGTSASGKTQIEAFLDDSFGFLLNARERLGWAMGKGRFEPFLGGFTDAEGSIFITDGKAAYSLGNNDRALLKSIKKGLEARGIKPVRIYQARKRYRVEGGYIQKHRYSHLSISRKKTLLNLFNMLGRHIRHKKRKADMQKAIDNITQRNARR